MKTAVKVDWNILESAIAKAEANGPLPNRSVLYDSVHAHYQELCPNPKVTVSVIMLRITKERDISGNLFYNVVTPVGKRGRVKGQKIVGGVRTKRRDKISEHSLDILRQSTPPQYHNLINKLGEGSIKAAIKLNCLNCVCWERTVKVDDSDAKGVDQIGDCEAFTCPMWNFRPYQKG